MSRFADLKTRVRQNLMNAAIKVVDLLTREGDFEDEGVDGEEGADTQEADSGTLHFTMLGRWVDGTTLRDLMAGATASSAIWCATDDECKPLDKAVMMHGPYLVSVRVVVDFEAVDPTEVDLRDVYNASALVHRLQVDDGSDIEMH